MFTSKPSGTSTAARSRSRFARSSRIWTTCPSAALMAGERLIRRTIQRRHRARSARLLRDSQSLGTQLPQGCHEDFAATMPPELEIFSNGLAYSITRGDLNAKTLRLFKLVRAAMIYVLLGMHREEARRVHDNRSLRSRCTSLSGKTIGNDDVLEFERIEGAGCPRFALLLG